MKIILERVKKGQTNEKWTLATDALELSSKRPFGGISQPKMVISKSWFEIIIHT
jgi:hypothetical protein